MSGGDRLGSGPLATESPLDKARAMLMSGKGIIAIPHKMTKGKE